ncbi:hypothetical protein [Rhodocyclus tenuis]|uniref:Putative nucleotidyltransferase n=1 Tax=Rhodocyclus tenuis TaxID=1066 RepID=A0A840FW34_RHOTE|nr:hypothetical protein [Rhodocyclus tenuis]MBB4245964.1 putative nucleotidyltransferase [Rhodocyclus tenuis]
MTQESAFTSTMKCLERSGKPTSGITIKKIETEIRFTALEVSEIKAIYGFGSFFRSQHYNDIDILVVASPLCEDCLSTYYEFRSKIASLGLQLGVVFDITFLTAQEFDERPLLEMDKLVEIFRRAFS